MEQGLGSTTWWEEAEYKQLGIANLRALFVLDKLIKKNTPKFQAAWAVAFPGRLMYEPSQIQPDEVRRGPWLVILTRMGASGRRGTLASPLAYSRRWAGSVAAWWAEGAPTILIRRLLPANP